MENQFSFLIFYVNNPTLWDTHHLFTLLPSRCHYSNLAFSLLAHVLAERVASTDYQKWITDNILDRLGMEDTGFDITPGLQGQVAVGVYSNGKPAPLYDLGWYRPSGQMFSTAADLAKLAMVLLGAYHRKLLEPDSLKIMLTPLFRCDKDYFANRTGTPWEANEQLGYEVVRKDGDLDGYSATFSLVPRLKLGLVVLMAGSRSQNQDVVTKAYNFIIPAIEKAFREAKKILFPPPNPEPYVGFFTYSNITFYEIKVGTDGVLIMQQFGPQIEELIPEKFRTIKLNYLVDRVFRVVFEKEYPCVLQVGSASVSLEAQDGQLFNFYTFDKRGLSPGFDAPGLNTYNVVRIARKPSFSSWTAAMLCHTDKCVLGICDGKQINGHVLLKDWIEQLASFRSQRLGLCSWFIEWDSIMYKVLHRKWISLLNDVYDSPLHHGPSLCLLTERPHYGDIRCLSFLLLAF